MNWDAVGAVGEMIGSVAVLATLGYLAVQVKYAREETRRALGQGRSEAHRDLLAQLRDRPVADAVLKVNVALGAQHPPFVTTLMEAAGCTLEEAWLVWITCSEWWTYNLQIIPYVDELQEIERTSFERTIRLAYGQPGHSRFFYETYVRATAHHNAIRYVDNLLAQPG